MKSTRDDPDVGRFPQPFVFTPIGEKTKVGMRSDFIYDADPLYQALIDKFDGIIEVGQNSSGYWIKFSDGTLIEWGNLYNPALTIPAGNPIFPWYIAIPCSSIDKDSTVVCSLKGIWMTQSWLAITNAYQDNYSSIAIAIYPFTAHNSGSTMPAGNIELYWLVIGRWK
jgi:hypothetical protein